jgi:hypothetical protein
MYEHLSSIMLCGGMDLIDLAQDRDTRRNFVTMVMNLRVPEFLVNFLTSLLASQEGFRSMELVS